MHYFFKYNKIIMTNKYEIKESTRPLEKIKDVKGFLTTINTLWKKYTETDENLDIKKINFLTTEKIKNIANFFNLSTKDVIETMERWVTVKKRQYTKTYPTDSLDCIEYIIKELSALDEKEKTHQK